MSGPSTRQPHQPTHIAPQANLAAPSSSMSILITSSATDETSPKVEKSEKLKNYERNYIAGNGLEYNKLVMFGDSITQDSYKQDYGWCLGPGLQDHYVRRLDVLNRGFSGYNTDQGVSLLPNIIKNETSDASRIALVTIFFGSNDSTVHGQFQHVPIERFISNIRSMVKTCEKNGIPVVLIGPAPFDWHSWANMRPEVAHERTTLRHREYCNAVAAVAAELEVPVVRMWDEVMEEIGWKEGEQLPGLEEGPDDGPLKEYFWDGLHFSGPAYRCLFRCLVKAIDDNYGYLSAELTPQQMPIYDQIPSIEYLIEQMNKPR